MKRWLAVAGALALGGCFHSQDTRTHVSMTPLMAANNAPWLVLSAGPDSLKVHDADPKVELAPSPAVGEVLQAQLRHAVQAAYRTNLTIACDGLDVEMRADAHDTTDTATLDVAMHCSINAAGFVSEHDYQAAPAMAVKDGSDGQAYAAALQQLLQQAAHSIGASLSKDIAASASS